MSEDKYLFTKYVSFGYKMSIKNTKLFAAFYKKNFGKYMPKNKNAKILEIGFGRGDFLRYLIQEKYDNFLGVEIGSEQYDSVRKNITDKILLIEDIFDFLEKNINTFDVVLFVDVLEHIEKDRIITFLKAVNMSLKSDGVVFCRVPNIANPFTLRARYKDFTHTVGFTTESLWSVFTAADFQKVIVKGESVNVSFLGAVVQFLRGFIGLFIRLICVIYGSNTTMAKNIIAIAKKY